MRWPDFFQPILRRKGRIFLICVAGGYLWIALRGPQGFGALLDRRAEIRQLEEENSQLARENDRRREHIKRLAESRSEQEMEIRKQLKLLRPGETTFILPDAAQDSGSDSGTQNPEPAADPQ